MGQKSGSGWVWLTLVGAAVYALLPHDKPAPPALVEAPIAVAVGTPEPARPAPPSPDALVGVAKRLLRLTQTGQFRSRDIHARALFVLDAVPTGVPEFAEAQQLRRAIAAAYTGNGARTPEPDSSPLPPELVIALQAPQARSAPDAGRVTAQRSLAPAADGQAIELGLAVPPPAALAPSPVAAPSGQCEENGSCYGDVSATTDRPKTTHVNGYFRSNGTYVRGHYRSK